MSQKSYDKSMFELVQENERLLDKPLKTKQLSYFQDAMLRFTKNKYNVVATVILAIFILMSIFVPIITPKNLYNQTNSSLTTLPPRIPVLEKIGLFDGTKLFKDQPIDYATYDEETGLGYPTVGFQVDYIIMDTLKNNEIYGSERSPLYIGGLNQLYVNTGRNAYSIVPKTPTVYAAGHKIEVEVESIDSKGVAKLYLSNTPTGTSLNSWDQLIYLGEITSAGTHTPLILAMT